MGTTVLEMYITLVPAVLAGIFNMIWCTLPILRVLSKPIDAGKNFADGKRIFGENKTWKGFVGMLIFGILFTVLWGWICGKAPYLQAHNYLYRNYENKLIYNISMGFLIGFAYALFELPNSFLKRRIDITPGKVQKGASAAFFVFLDQADSVFGVVLVVAFVYPMSLSFYLIYVILGAATHIVLNVLLYFAKLRKNPF